MRIKLAILEKDRNYLNRLVNVFNTKYADKLEIYSFTDFQIAMSGIEESRINVFLASDEFVINVGVLPQRCGFAYLVESPEIGSFNNQRAICKYQKADLIYKQILGIYSDNASNIIGTKLRSNSCNLIAFTSPAGGCGNSSVAAACASYFAGRNKKVLYLNLEKFGSAELFFSGEGQSDMSDIIFALKRKKPNLGLKIESCVKQDSGGVCFFSQSKLALDLLELNPEDVISLITEIQGSCSYDVIVIDLDFALGNIELEVMRCANTVIWVGDGSESSNYKIRRAYTSLAIIEQNSDVPIIGKISIIYNKFSNKIGQTISDLSIRNIGGAPRFDHATAKQVVKQISQLNIFDEIE